MKRILFIFIVATLFLSCQKSNKLYIYNCSYYIPSEVLMSFEKEYNCKVVYDVFSSNEEMYAKIKAGGSGYDIIFPSGDFVSIMISEGILEKIDKNKIENFKNIDTNILQKINFDRGNIYSVPYIMGAVGIAINKKFVSENENSYSIYNNPAYKNKMTLLDDMREVIGAALSYNGYSVNSVNHLELEKTKSTVLGWKKIY